MTVAACRIGMFGLGLFCAVPALAQDLELEEVVVSAGRTPLGAEKVGRAYTVITGEDLERSQTRYLADALRKVPGVSVSRTGSVGGLTQVRLRGSEANHVLVLIDGVEVSASSSGEFDFGGLQVADVERIEVLRGPQSALYGSNAASGVIHIITKGGVRDGYEVSGRTEVGTDRTWLGAVELRGGGENFDLALAGAFRRTDGFNLSDYGSEKDGDRNLTLYGKGAWDLSETVRLDANLRYVDRKSDTDDQDYSFPPTPTEGQVIDTPGYNATREFSGGVGASWSLFEDRFVQKTRFELTDVERRGYGSGSENGNHDRRYHASYQGTFAFETPEFLSAAHSLTGAVEWEQETFRNTHPGTPSQVPTRSRDLFGYVAEYRGEFYDNLFISGALRFDQNDDFKNALTYSASAAYLVPETGTRFHASIGTGVTNPTFFEQFGFIPSSFIGNPNLRPEQNFGWDIGIEQTFWEDRVVADVTYFNERLEDEIQTRYLPGWVSTPVNLDGTSRRQGVEVALGVDVTENLHAKVSYTYLDATEPSGLQEVRRPRHSGSLGLVYGFDEGRGNLFLDAVYNGQMQDLEFISSTPWTRVTLDQYWLVNVGADYQLNDHVQLFGRVENLFDQDYQEVYGYNTQGLTAFVGLKGTF
ncbi:TonB-dependent receptor [Stappia taiwanensis]|uniref:TonB-dependent receptor n=1 Tax=Stappia taiwanensis TaxID=992267 RepID=A0A838XTL0_9HYPH|nr:TonB-dependent receptor [Stappia taiwanensis]MBA4613077.1 TonB-dependent receptor [Stappia taiwanensis]GGF01425.1 TonB-dependent receptor [Stappia taiwanensis]